MKFRLCTLFLVVFIVAALLAMLISFDSGVLLLHVLHIGFWMLLGAVTVGLPATALAILIRKTKLATIFATTTGTAILLAALGMLAFFAFSSTGYRLVDTAVSPNGKYVAKVYVVRSPFFFNKYEFSADLEVHDRRTGQQVATEYWSDFACATKIDPVSLEWWDSDTVVMNVGELPFATITVAKNGL